jgi:hypothetical protein
MTRAFVRDELTSATREWVDILRTNCLMLVNSSAANAVSVSKGFPRGADDEREAVVSLAHRIAEEYGLMAETRMDGLFLTIRFTRKPVPAPVESPAGTSLFWKLPAVFGRRRDSHGGKQPRVDEGIATRSVRES